MSQICLSSCVRRTGFFEVAGLGASLPVLGSVAAVRLVPAGEDHQSLEGQAQLDVAVEVCAAPQGVTQGRLPAAHRLLHQPGAFVSLQRIHFKHPFGPCGKTRENNQSKNNLGKQKWVFFVFLDIYKTR